MDITIQERKFSVRSDYNIDLPAGPWFARKAFFSVPARIAITSSAGAPIATLQGRWSFFRSRFDFRFTDGRNYQFVCEKRWKQVYTCAGDHESWQLMRHHGLRASVFRDDRQIAAIVKNRLILGAGNRYEIRMNHDADPLVIVSMVLALNTAQRDDEKRDAVTFEVGSLGPQEKPWDDSWQPT
ncbi:MAG TPA: hypothetical protein VHX37_05385 [Acidobacteriaceae bacterium]|jgi:uncharacterized protein YxjI|nr:hypothetical protein [Acidobacteriaceae bacterium]